jgi:hypothetical protein
MNNASRDKEQTRLLNPYTVKGISKWNDLNQCYCKAIKTPTLEGPFVNP